MKRGLALALVSLVSLVVLAPESPAQVGSSSIRWETRPSQLQILDAFTPLLRRSFRKGWRVQRNRILEAWAAAGVSFLRTPLTPAPVCEPGSITSVSPNTVVICRGSSNWAWWRISKTEWVGQEAIAWVDAAIISVANGWPALLCHEFGHALGASHRSGGDGCMNHDPSSSSPQPDDADLANARAALYW